MIHLFAYLTLIVPPTGIKLIKDRNGIQHPDPSEAWFVALICGCSGGIACILNDSLSLWEWVRATCVSGGSFWLLFPYLFNWMWFNKTIQPTIIRCKQKGLIIYSKIYNRRWYILNYLSDKAIPDKYNWWRKLGWAGRIIVYLLIFTITVIIYERRISLF